MTLPIFSDEGCVGVIEAGSDGPRFFYEPKWLEASEAFPISLSMPMVGESWGPERVTPWLMNLLPEGEPLRAMTRALGVAQEDVLALLQRTGRDMAGALTVGMATNSGHAVIATDADLERIINDLPAKPFLVGEEGVAMSLAGAQDKLPVTLIDGQFAIPINGAPSTHILKPDNPRLPGSVQNEALCMVLAGRCGLSVAETTTGVAGGRTYLLTTRYDRIRDGDAVRRIHQEDFCQALGRSPVAKYEHNGTGTRGPSLAEMFALVRAHMTARDITRLLDAVIFNIAIGNVDSHAKNYSILLRADGCELAPLYDLMSGLAWGNITESHAQDVGGQRRGRHIYGRHWRRMAEATGLAATATVRRVSQIVDRVLAELDVARETVAAMPAGAGALLDVFAGEIAARARTVGWNAKQDDGDGPGDPDDEKGPSSRYGV